MKDNIGKGHGPLSLKAQKLLAYFEEKLKDAPLAGERAGSVREGLKGLISSTADMETCHEALHRLEQRMHTIQEEIPSNVIPIRRPTLPKPTFSAVTDKRWILRLDCLIESRYISEIHKMAMELHAQSRRYAFLEYRDLHSKSRLDVSELLAMGAISLFVPSILDLTLAEQEILRQLMQVESLQRPLLMVGSTQTYSDLRGESGVNLDFLNDLSRAYIKLTKSFSEYKDQGLIHYFLDSLSESPS